MLLNYLNIISRYFVLGIRRSLRKKGFLSENKIEDTVLVSYPKSGRTWIRVVLDYLGIDINYDHDAAAIAYHPKKDYSDLNIDENKYEDKKVILLIRDPRDVVVSSYFHAVYRQNVFNGSISDFIRSKKFGIHKIIDFQKKWISSADIPQDFICFKYEDLKEQPVDCFKTLIDFIDDKKIPEKKIRKTVNLFSFQNMKKYEEKGIFRLRYGRILKPADNSNNNSYKVRKGKAGAYKDYLGKEDINYCDKIISERNF